MGDNSLSLPETKRLILRMIQAAALQKALSDDRVDPCPEWLFRRSLCSLPQSNVLSERLRDNDLNTLPGGGGQTNVEIVPDNSVILIKKQDTSGSEESEATGEWKNSAVRRTETNARTIDPDERRGNGFDGSDRIRHVDPVNVATTTTRGQRFFPRFLGKTVLNRPIRVESSRNPSGKRALDCIRKCIVEGGLHPVQCHSIC